MTPLSGLKVIDLTRALSGPFCAMILADLGADVVKVEPSPSGDMSRGWGPFDRGVSTYFLSCNRNKRSLCVDFRKPEGLEIIRRLIADADIVLENFKPGTIDKMGLGYAALSRSNPRLIMGSISAFGADGPLSQWPGFDQIAQGYSGLMSLTGYPDGDPTRTGTAIGDLTSGMWLSVALLGALLERERSGVGQHVSTSLLSSLVSLLSVHGQRYLSLGEVAKRTGNAHAVIAPYGVFETADGPLNLAPITSDMWINLWQALDLPALGDDPRFATNELRVANRDALKTAIESRLRERPKKEWTELFVKVGLPAAAINTLDEVFNDPQVRHNHLVEQVRHATLGDVRVVTTPLSDGRERTGTTLLTRHAPPLLGEHTVEILRSAGFDEAAIEALCGHRVVRQAEMADADASSGRGGGS